MHQNLVTHETLQIKCKFSIASLVITLELLNQNHEILNCLVQKLSGFSMNVYLYLLCYKIPCRANRPLIFKPPFLG